MSLHSAMSCNAGLWSTVACTWNLEIECRRGLLLTFCELGSKLVLRHPWPSLAGQTPSGLRPGLHDLGLLRSFPAFSWRTDEFERDGQKLNVSCEEEAGVKLRGESGPFCIEMSMGWLNCKYWLQIFDSVDYFCSKLSLQGEARSSEHPRVPVSGISWSRGVSCKCEQISEPLYESIRHDVHDHMTRSDERGSGTSTGRSRCKRILFEDFQYKRGSSCQTHQQPFEMHLHTHKLSIMISCDQHSDGRWSMLRRSSLMTSVTCMARKDECGHPFWTTSRTAGGNRMTLDAALLWSLPDDQM